MYLSLSSSPSPTDPVFTSNTCKLYTSKIFSSLSIPSSISKSIYSIFLRCPSFSTISYSLLLCNLDRSSSKARTSSIESSCVFIIFHRSWILSFLNPILFSRFFQSYCLIRTISNFLKYSPVNLHLRVY